MRLVLLQGETRKSLLPSAFLCISVSLSPFLCLCLCLCVSVSLSLLCLCLLGPFEDTSRRWASTSHATDSQHLDLGLPNFLNCEN